MIWEEVEEQYGKLATIMRRYPGLKDAKVDVKLGQRDWPEQLIKQAARWAKSEGVRHATPWA